MKPSVDMALFLTAVLKGAHATRQRHLNQARLIQAAIQQRWQLDNPRRWQLKHLQWLMREHLAEHSPHSRYYYGLTVRLIVRRLGKERDWTGRESPQLPSKGNSELQDKLYIETYVRPDGKRWSTSLHSKS